MRKIPVFDTVGAAFSFLIKNAGTVFRLAWFPQLFVAFAALFAGIVTLEVQMAMLSGNPAPGGAVALAISLIVWLVQIAGWAMVAVALHRLILFGDDKAGTFVLFKLGRTELLFMAIPLVLVVLGFFGTLILAIAAANLTGGRPPLLFALLPLAIFIAFFCLGVRLAPLYPIIVIEDRINLRQALNLSLGNFWRILAVIVLGFLPIVIVFVLLVLAAEPVARTFLSGLSASATIEQVTNRLRAMVLVQSVVGYILSIITAGLGVALVCFTYRALRGLPPEQLLTPEYEVR